MAYGKNEHEEQLAKVAQAWVAMVADDYEPVVVNEETNTVTVPEGFHEFFMAETENIPEIRDEVLRIWDRENFVTYMVEAGQYIVTEKGMQYFRSR